MERLVEAMCRGVAAGLLVAGVWVGFMGARAGLMAALLGVVHDYSR